MLCLLVYIFPYTSLVSNFSFRIEFPVDSMICFYSFENKSPSSLFLEDAPLVEFMYLVFACMPG